MRVLAKRGAEYLIGERLAPFEPVMVYSDKLNSLSGPTFVYETRGFERIVLPPSHEAHVLDSALALVAKHMTPNPEHDEPGEEQQVHAGGGAGAGDKPARLEHFKHDPSKFKPIKLGKTQTGAKLEAAIAKEEAKLAQGLDLEGVTVQITEQSAIASMDELFDAANQGQVAYGEEWYDNAGKQADKFFERFKDEIPGLTRDMCAVVLAGASPGAKWDDAFGTPEQAKTSNQVTSTKILEAWADNLPVKISEDDVRLAKMYITEAKLWPDLEMPKPGEYAFRDLATRDPRLAFLFKTNFAEFDPESNKKGGAGFGWGGSPVQVLPGLKALAGVEPQEALGDESKVRSFYTNIARSMTGQQDEHATLDIWMARAMQSNRNLKRTMFGKFYGAASRYELMRRWVEKAAQKRGLSPKQYQAIVWSVIARPDEEQKERFGLAKERKKKPVKTSKAFGLDTEGDEFDMMWLARAIAHERGENVDDDPFFGPWDEDDQARLDSLTVTKAALFRVTKHLAGTEHDHDQSEHGRGGGGDKGSNSDDDVYVKTRRVGDTTIVRDEETGYATLVRAADGQDEDGSRIVMIEDHSWTREQIREMRPVGRNVSEGEDGYPGKDAPIQTMHQATWEKVLAQGYSRVVLDREEVEETVRGRIVRAVQEAANQLGTSEEEVKTTLNLMAEDIAKGPLLMRKRDRGMLAILEEDRFLTQFATGSTSGYFGADSRSIAEANMFGYPPNLDPEKRPLYGYLMDTQSGLADDNQADNYGSWRIVMNDEVKDRTTAYLGDTLGYAESGEAAPRPVRGMNYEVLTQASSGHSVADMIRNYRDENKSASTASYNYMETQIHGTLRLKHVKEIGLVTEGGSTRAVAKLLGVDIEAGQGFKAGEHTHKGVSIDDLIKAWDDDEFARTYDSTGRQLKALKKLKERGFTKLSVTTHGWPKKWRDGKLVEQFPAMRINFERE